MCIYVCASSIMRLSFRCANPSYPYHSRSMVALFDIGSLCSCSPLTYLNHCIYMSYTNVIHQPLVFAQYAYVCFNNLVIDKDGRMSRYVASMFTKLALNQICVTYVYTSFQIDAPFSLNHVMCLQTLLYLWNQPNTETFAQIRGQGQGLGSSFTGNS